MKRASVLFLSCFVIACTGSVEEPDAGTTVDAGPVDAGPQPIKYTQFTLRNNGWPSGAAVRGAVVFDNVLYAANDQGLFALPATDVTWKKDTSPLTGDLLPSSLVRFDQTLVLTAAGASAGGVWVKTLDDDWTQVAGAPTAPTWSISRKSGQYLLVATGGLYVADALDGAWRQRSDAGVFAAPVRTFAAAPAQQKLFAASTTLFESNDQGATWVASALTGTVEALAASGAFVLASTSGDGQRRSDNYGNTFKPQTSPIQSGVSFYVAQGETFWAGGNGGLFTSADDGLTFTAVQNGLPSGVALRGVYFAGGYVIADTVDGPYLTQQ